VKHLTALAKTTAALATAALLGAALVLVPSVADAHSTSGGYSACDHRAQYGDIPCSEVDRAITEAAAEFGVDEGVMRRIARCESRFDPFASNGPYQGLYQQSTQYWDGRVADFNAHVRPGVSGNIHHPFDNARVSARMMTQGGNHWPNC
jgi:hypothetical protein